MVYLVAMTVVFLAGFQASVNLLFLLFGFGLGLGLTHSLVAGAALRRIEVTREAPDAVLADRPFTIRYRIHNRRARGDAHSLRITEYIAQSSAHDDLIVEGYVPLVRAGEILTLDVEITASYRGILRFSTIAVSSRFPFGIDARRLTIPAEHATEVYPALLALRRKLVDDRRKAAWDSLSRREQPRGIDEFHGLREHRAGESLRWVHWRRSARTGQLLVREMSDVRPQSIMVVVDAHGHEAPGAGPLESAISAAGTVICDALENGFKVGLVILSESSVVIPPASGRGLRARLMGELARIKGAPTESAEAILSAQRWPGHWRGRAFLLAARPTEDLGRAAAVLRRRSNHLDVITGTGTDFGGWFGRPTARKPASGNGAETTATGQGVA